MSASHVLTIRCVLSFLGLLLAQLACTNRFGREPITDRPVAGATSTPLPLATESQEPGPRSSSEPDVPFDGARPEALAVTTPSAPTPTPTARVTGSSVVFDVYRELLQGSLVCTGAQQ